MEEGKKKKELTTKEAVELSKKQAQNLTKYIITRLEELIEQKEITHLILITTLRHSIKRVIDDIIAFRPDILPKISLEGIGLRKLYEVLEEIEKEKAKEIRKYEESQGYIKK